jgi:hypothetical protein
VCECVCVCVYVCACMHVCASEKNVGEGEYLTLAIEAKSKKTLKQPNHYCHHAQLHDHTYMTSTITITTTNDVTTITTITTTIHQYHHHPSPHKSARTRRSEHRSVGDAGRPTPRRVVHRPRAILMVRSTTFNDVQERSRTVCGVKYVKYMGCTRGMRTCAYDADSSRRHPA